MIIDGQCKEETMDFRQTRYQAAMEEWIGQEHPASRSLLRGGEARVPPAALEAEHALLEARRALVQAFKLFEQAGCDLLAIGFLEEALVAVDTVLDQAMAMP